MVVALIPLLAEEGRIRAIKIGAKPPSGVDGVVRPAQRVAELTTPSARTSSSHPPLLCEEGNAANSFA
jgi:hypothetical protein